MARSLYGVLGVSPLAGEGEIKAAFRKLAKQFHPDLHAGDKRAEQRFKEINEAHARLSDPHARATYDASLSQERSLKRQRFRNAAAIMATTFVLAVTLISTAMVWRQHENGLLLRSADRLSTKSLTNQGRRAVAVLEDETTSVQGNRAEPLALPSSERHIETSTAAQTSIESTLVDTRSPNLGDVNSVERAFRSDARLQESERPAPAGGRLTMSDGGRSTEEVTQTQAAAPEASRAGRTALAPALPLGKDAANWAIYRNTHFGFALGYPADIFVADPKQSDENVRRFVSRDGGAVMQIFGTPNLAERTLTQYRAVLIEERYANAKFDYAPLRDTWFVLSGVAGDVTFYERVTFSCDRRLFHGWRLVFPSSERLLYEAIIEAMHRKYRHSNGPAASCGAVKPNLSPQSAPG